MHYQFHVNVFARPAGKVFDAFLPVSFDEAFANLARLPRLDAEPDGFFVYAGGAGATHWCVSGQVADFGGRVHRVQLNGRCPAESLDALLGCFGWPATPLAFELIEQGAVLDETDFRAASTEASRAVPAPAPPNLPSC
ncbi:MAG TPA: hypothetical protein VEQ85_04585 [Lacipirellulaceae bacterium]|nr:hypothetical protein [Lacipirellulaceae bacterium]